MDVVEIHWQNVSMTCSICRPCSDFLIIQYRAQQAIDILDEARAAVQMERAFQYAAAPSSNSLLEVTEHDVSEIISMWTNIPFGKANVDKKVRRFLTLSRT